MQKRGVQVIYFACNNDVEPIKCTGTLNAYLLPTGEKQEVAKKPHNEECTKKVKSDIEAKKKDVNKLRTSFFNEVKKDPSARKTKNTYQRVVSNANVLLRSKLTYSQVSRHARRLKSKEMKKTVRLPNLQGVKTIQELGAAFIKAEESGNPYSFKIDGKWYPIKTIILDGDEKQRYSILWLVEDHVRQYERVKLAGDGTFGFCPKLTGRDNHQFFTLTGNRHGRPIPIAFTLMSSKKEVAYEYVFRTIAEKFPELDPRELLMDYEKAPRNAAKTVWPNIKLVGCFFHYSQNIEKHSKKTIIRKRLQRRNEDPKRYAFKRKIQTLALLRPQDMAEGFTIVRKEGEAFNDAQATTLVKYVDKTWMKEDISVFGEINRTNNFLESSHSGMKEHGKSPSLLTFTDFLNGEGSMHSTRIFMHVHACLCNKRTDFIPRGLISKIAVAHRFRDAMIQHEQMDKRARIELAAGQPLDNIENLYYSICERTTSQKKYDEALMNAWAKLRNGSWTVAVFLDKMSAVTSKKFNMSVEDFLTSPSASPQLSDEERTLSLASDSDIELQVDDNSAEAAALEINNVQEIVVVEDEGISEAAVIQDYFEEPAPERLQEMVVVEDKVMGEAAVIQDYFEEPVPKRTREAKRRAAHLLKDIVNQMSDEESPPKRKKNLRERAQIGKNKKQSKRDVKSRNTYKVTQLSNDGLKLKITFNN